MLPSQVRAIVLVGTLSRSVIVRPTSTPGRKDVVISATTDTVPVFGATTTNVQIRAGAVMVSSAH